MAVGTPDHHLVRVLEIVAAHHYRFTTVTPATHARILARDPGRLAHDLRDVFGWNRPFAPSLLPADLLQALSDAAAIEDRGGRFRSRVRIASVGSRLFLHSAYPTDDRDAVFLGPDTYRFIRFMRQILSCGRRFARLVDIGTGSGAGALAVSDLVPGARITLSDVNAKALRLAGANACHAGIEVECVEGAGLDQVSGPIDLILANPPYVADDSDRTYRSGGGLHGGALSRDWALVGAERLAPGGMMLLYTGSAIVGGRDALRASLEAELPKRGCSLRYKEIDPDVFGEELGRPAYADVERIAAVGAVIQKS
jgi:hypothetical protein